jgi:hypothetical protein
MVLVRGVQMSNEQRVSGKIAESKGCCPGVGGLNNAAGGKKSCLDCLYCKVSVRSTKNRRLCFCSQTVKKEKHREPFWRSKRLCDGFDDMTA